MGPKSTILKTQCLCDHLTFFSSDFFIVPRTVDVENTIKLLLHVSNNPVGVSLLASLLGFYILLATWAWRKDQADTQKVRRLGPHRPRCVECVKLDRRGRILWAKEQRSSSGAVVSLCIPTVSEQSGVFACLLVLVWFLALFCLSFGVKVGSAQKSCRLEIYQKVSVIET